MNQRMDYVDAIFLVYKEHHVSSTLMAQLIIQIAAISASKQQRSLPMLFQPFRPSLMQVENVEQPNQPKKNFFAIIWVDLDRT